MTRLIGILILIPLTNYYTFGQSSPNPDLLSSNAIEVNANMPTPTAGGLGKFGNTQMDISTGHPNITVPLYTLTYNGLSVPISMKYDASGIKIDQHPTWVGLGWNLMAGGVITRQVQDMPDDYVFPESSQNNYDGTMKGYYFSSALIPHTPSWNSISTLAQLAAQYQQVNTWNPKYLADGVPDDFTFSFGGYSGSFFLDETGEWHVKSKENLGLKITVTPNSSPFLFSSCPGNMYIPSLFLTIVIQTPDGTRYQFGGDVNSIEFSRPIQDDFWLQVSQNLNKYDLTPTAWYLTKITKPDGTYIEFDYEKGLNLMRFQRSIQANETTTQYSSSSSDNQEYLLGNILTPCYLKQISTPLQTIRFFRSYTSQMTFSPEYVIWINHQDPNVSNGQISGGGSLGRTLNLFARQALMSYAPSDPTEYLRGWPDFQCVQDYVLNPDLTSDRWLTGGVFANVPIPDYSQELDSIIVSGKDTSDKAITVHFDYTHNDNLRLMLEDLSIKGKSNDDGGAYKFSYFLPDSIPNYNFLTKDQWGYNNGKNYTFDGNNMYNNNVWRLPNERLTKYGTLTKIEYPTGGITRFEYELNDYSKYQKVVLSDAVGATGYTALSNTANNTKAGGLRVKAIYDSAGNNSPVVVKHYYYNTDYIHGGTSSSGILSGKPQYTQKMKFYNQCESSNSYNTNWSDCEFNPYGEVDKQVTYGEVTEVSNDGSAKVYKFSNFDSPGGLDEYNLQAIFVNILESDIYQLTSNSLERGLLLSETDYNASGNKVHDKLYTYQYDASRKDKFAKCIRRLDDVRLKLNPDLYYWMKDCYFSNIYRLYSFKKYYYHIPLSSVTENYYESTGTITSKNEFTYDEYGNITKQISKTSDNKIITTDIKYNSSSDYLNGTATSVEAQGIRNLYSQFNIVNAPVEKITTIGPDPDLGTTTPDQTSVTSAMLFQYYKNKPVISKVYAMELLKPFPLYIASGTGFTYNLSESKIQNGNLTFDSRYAIQQNITPYSHNDDGKPGTVVDAGKATAYTWDYDGEMTSSVTENANSSDVAYSSFEGKDWYLAIGNPDDNKGNWDFSPTDIYTAGAFTGNNSLMLVSQGPIGVSAGVKSTQSLSSGVKYELSFWAKGSAPSVKLGAVQQPMRAPVKTINGWDLYIYPIVGNNTQVSVVSQSTTTAVTQTTAYLDEVRLYPQNAGMKTYTYDKITQNVMAVGDDQNNYTFYSYDGLGRLIQIKDENGNIQNQYSYHLIAQ